MGIQSLAISLGLLAVSNNLIVQANARRLGWRPPPPPGPPGKNGKWVWVTHSHPVSSSSSEDWAGDGHHDEVVATTPATLPAEGWEGDGYGTTTTEMPPTPPPPTPNPTIPPTIPEATEPPTAWSDDGHTDDWEGDAPTYAPTGEEEDDDDDDDKPNYPVVDGEATSRGPLKIVGSIKTDDEAGKNPDGMKTGHIVAIAAGVAALAALAVFVAGRRRQRFEQEIDPESDELMLDEEEDFVGDGDIPPPPPMEANEDAIEIDESFLDMGEEVEVGDLSVDSDGLESI